MEKGLSSGRYINRGKGFGFLKDPARVVLIGPDWRQTWEGGRAKVFLVEIVPEQGLCKGQERRKTKACATEISNDLISEK